MKKYLYLFIILVYSSTFYGNLSISKSYILFDGNTRNDSINVVNQADDVRTYKVYFIHYKQNKDGSYTKVDKESDDLKFADAYLDYTPKRFTLKPKSTQLLRLQKKSMATANDGEYMAQLIIEEQPFKIAPQEAVTKTDTVQVEIHALYSVTLPVVLRKGELKVENKIEKVSITEVDNVSAIYVEISRVGNRSTRGRVVVKHNDQVVVSYDNVNIFISSNLRSINMKLGATEVAANAALNKIKGKTVQVEYIDQLDNKVLASKEVVL